MLLTRNRLGQTCEYKDLNCSLASDPCSSVMEPVERKSPRCLWRRNKA